MSIFITLLHAAAVVLLVLLIAQTAMMLVSLFRRFSFAQTQRKLELEIYGERLRGARAEAKKKVEDVLPWNGYRKFTVDRKVNECDDVWSFYLKPHDGRPLPSFFPGQYLTFELQIPGHERSVVRCYSLSDRPRNDYYRVTIKRLPHPPDKPDVPAGVASNHFGECIKEGDILDVKAPAGGFHLSMTRNSPVVLIGGGVGITPILSMLNAIIESESRRETWFFYGVRNSKDHIMKEYLQRIARECDFVHLHVCYSKPGKDDKSGIDYDHEGHVNIDLLRRELPSSNFDFLICGPGSMMAGITAGLREWNVPEGKIHFEAFGPASVNRPPKVEKTQKATGLTVTFARSAKSEAWAPDKESLLDFAEHLNVRIDSGCRAGNCGTCKTAIKSGKVTYLKEPGCDVESGSCLTCICIPETEVILDA